MSSIQIPQRRTVLQVMLAVVCILPVTLLVLLGFPPLQFDTPIATVATTLVVFSRVFLLLAGGYAAWIIVRQLRDPRPLLVIDDLGVHSLFIRDGLLAWRDIAGAEAEHIVDEDTHAAMVRIRLRDGLRAVERLDPLPGPIGWFARRDAARNRWRSR